MTVFALLSELPRLSPTDLDRVTHVILDDGTWPDARITAYIALWSHHWPDPLPHPEPEDWSRFDGELL